MPCAAGLGLLGLLLGVTPTLPAQGNYDTPYEITSVAGQGLGEDGPGYLANFNAPYGTAVDVSGNVYVADNTNHKIRKITPAGVVSTFAGSGAVGSADGTGTAASFNFPRGIAIDSTGNLFIADTQNRKIRKITPAGVVSTFAGSGASGSGNGTGIASTFNGPRGIAIDASGNLYVADTGSRKIRKITPDAVVTTFAGSGSPGSANGAAASATFTSPYGVAVDASDNVYVADLGNNRIRIIAAGIVSTFAGSGSAGSADGTGTSASFSSPSGVAVDASGNVYVGDAINNMIRKITSAGVVTTLAGNGARGSANGPGAGASFSGPAGLAVDASGNIYVADSGGNLIRVVTAGGVVSTLAGTGSSGSGSADGMGPSASFNYPKGLVAGPGGTLYVMDTSNQKVRLILPNGSVTTFAGSGGNGSTDGNGTATSFNYPFSLAMDAAGVLYIADTNNHKIRKITPAGDVTTIAGTGSIGSTDANGTSASFNYPFGIAVNASGTLFVADTNNHKVRKIATNGDVTTLAGSGVAGGTDANGISASFTNPTGIAVDAGGTLYIGDTYGHKIRKIALNGDVTTLAGSGLAGYADGTGTAAQFNTPQGLVVDAAGNVFVADTTNNLIRKITPAGVVTTVAGSTTSGNVDATGAAARFNQPSGVAIDSSGNLFIVDASNHKIRKGVALVPLITSNLNASGTYGIAFSYAVTATNAPTSYTATGLPTGLSIDAATGAISGTPTQTGNFAVILGAANVYGSGTAGLTLTVARASAAVVLGGLSRTYNGSPQSATAVTTPSGLAVVFTYDGSSTAPTAAGSYTVTGTVSDSNYTGTVSATLSIAKAAQVISFNSLSGSTFGDAPFTVGATADSGLAVTFSIVSGPASLSGGNTITVTGVGPVVVRASQAGNANYNAASPVAQSFTVAKGVATVTLGALSLTFDGTAKAVSATTSPVGLNVGLTYQGSSTAPSAAGSYPIVATITDANYSGTATGTLTIAKASQAITFNAVSGATYGNTPFAVSATASSALAVTFSIASGPATLTGGNTVTIVGAGAVVVRASQGGDLNYLSAPNVDQTFTVGKANQSIAFGALVNRTYGDAPFLVSASASSARAVSFSVVSGPATISGTSVTLTGAGTVIIRATQPGDSNYNSAPAVDQTFSIGKATATVVLGGLSATYDGTAQRVTTATNPAGLTVISTYDGSATAPIATGNYAVVATISDANYAGAVSGTLSIDAVTQSITFPAPADRLTNAAPFSVSATATSGLPVNFVVVSGPATVSGSTVTLIGSAGTVTLRATQAGNDTYAAATAVERSFAVATPVASTAAPVITLQPVNQSVTAGATASFTAGATGSPTPSFQWRRNGVPLAGQGGANLSLGGLTLADSGAVFDVVVSNAAGSVTSVAAALTVSPVITTNQLYLGALGTGGSYALAIDPLGGAVLIGYLPNGRGSFILRFKIAPDGTFLATTTVTTATATARSTREESVTFTARAVASIEFSGRIANGQLVGQVDGTGEIFSGTAQAVGAAPAFVGYYEAPLVNGASGNIYLIVAADGTAMGARVDGSGITAAVGRVLEDGQFSVQFDASTVLQGSLTGVGTLTGQAVTNGTISDSFLGVAPIVAHTDRLVNISARGMAGDNDKIMIAGFVISGDQPKDVLIRAIGPGLTALGVDSAMENPVLTLYHENQQILGNDDWDVATDAVALSAAAARVGAFALATGSKDAAILATLAPGSYTVQITRVAESANGVALIEVYDASASPGAEAQKLINLTETPMFSERPSRFSKPEIEKGHRLCVEGRKLTPCPERLDLRATLQSIAPAARSFAELESLLSKNGITVAYRLNPAGQRCGISFAQGDVRLTGKNAGLNFRELEEIYGNEANEINRIGGRVRTAPASTEHGQSDCEGVGAGDSDHARAPQRITDRAKYPVEHNRPATRAQHADDRGILAATESILRQVTGGKRREDPLVLLLNFIFGQVTGLCDENDRPIGRRRSMPINL